MDLVTKAAPLYTFLWHCNASKLSKEVLDCGAGGARPPLAIFCQQSYSCTGIDISANRLALAREYLSQHNLQAELLQSDMRQLPFPTASFGFVFSYNSVFHMRKGEIATAISEMKRVLRPGGLLFVNFLSVEDPQYGAGSPVGDGSFLQEEDDGVVHSYFADDEADAYFAGHSLVHKEKRDVQFLFRGEWVRSVFLDYIVEAGQRIQHA